MGFLVAQCALSYGYFISSSVKNMESATSVAPLLTMPAILFGGFFANNTGYTIAALGYLRFISPIYYANCGILLADYRTADIPAYTRALSYLVGDKISYTECIWALIALLVFWRTLSFIALRRSVTKF
jgi:hypothetical protein